MGDQPDNSVTLAQNPAYSTGEPGGRDGFGGIIRLVMAIAGIVVIIGPVVLGYSGIEMSCSNRIFLIGPYVIAGLVAGYYFFSPVTLAIQTPIGPAANVSIRAGGSAAFGIIAGIAGYLLFPPKTCETPRSYVRIMDLPTSAEDASIDDIFTKHWDKSNLRSFDYEFEISANSNLPQSSNPRIRLHKGSSPASDAAIYCILQVIVDAHASVDKTRELETEDSVSGPIYRIYYNSAVGTASNLSRDSGDKTECFVTHDPASHGKTIHSVKLTPNGAQFVDDDKIKAAAIN